VSSKIIQGDVFTAMAAAGVVYEEIRKALQTAEREADYPDLLRRLCLLVDAEKARLQQEGRFWCAQSVAEKRRAE
jgi:hypothetical protein